MPSGSKARLTRFISAISSSRQLDRQELRLGEADAVFAADRALERDHAFEERRSASCARAISSASSGVDHDVDVDVAVAGMPEARDAQAVVAA